MFKRDGDNWKIPDSEGRAATYDQLKVLRDWGDLPIGHLGNIETCLRDILSGSALLKQFLKSDTGHLGVSYFKADKEHSKELLAAYFVRGFAKRGLQDDSFNGAYPLEGYMTFSPNELEISTAEGFVDRYQIIHQGQFIHIINNLSYTMPGAEKTKLIFTRETMLSPLLGDAISSIVWQLSIDFVKVLYIVADANHSSKWSANWEDTRRPKKVISAISLDDAFGQPPTRHRKRLFNK